MAGSPQGFVPDDVYCVYCHAPAAGLCATCQALICTDCAELTGGASRRVAVCRQCFSQGRGSVDWGGWRGYAVLAIGLLLLLAIGLLVRAVVPT